MIKVTVNTQAEGKVHMMPISNELKQAGQHAYQAYNERLREERKDEENAQRQKRKGEERSRKARRGKKTLGGSRDG